MENIGLYQDIAKRTDGDIYIGVVGPVRTGKSTFIKKFMDLLVIPNIDNELGKEVATTNKVLKEKAEISYEQGVENAKNFSSDASIEALMAMGGTLVE